MNWYCRTCNRYHHVLDPGLFPPETFSQDTGAGYIAKTAGPRSWDPTVCEHCGGRMSDPRQLGNKWVNSCTNCGSTRDVPARTPLLQQQQQNWPPYPDVLNQVGPQRAWVAKTAATPIAQQAYQAIIEHGGITIGLAGDQPHSGYAFSLDPKSESITPQSQLTPEIVEQYLQSHQSQLSQAGNYLGAWVNEGSVYLDVSRVEPDLHKAMEMAAAANQLAIFDLATFEEIPVQRIQPEQPAMI